MIAVFVAFVALLSGCKYCHINPLASTPGFWSVRVYMYGYPSARIKITPGDNVFTVAAPALYCEINFLNLHVYRFIDVYFYGQVWSFDDLAHYNCTFLLLLYAFAFISIANCYLTIQWQIQGRGLGGPASLSFGPNWGPNGRKNFLEDRPASLISRSGSVFAIRDLFMM